MDATKLKVDTRCAVELQPLIPCPVRLALWRRLRTTPCNSTFLGCTQYCSFRVFFSVLQEMSRTVLPLSICLQKSPSSFLHVKPIPPGTSWRCLGKTATVKLPYTASPLGDVKTRAVWGNKRTRPASQHSFLNVFSLPLLPSPLLRTE